MFVTDTQGRLPVFEQLKKQTLEFTIIGILSSSDRLPSAYTMALQIGVNPSTVVKTYQELEEHGYIYSEREKGCFVTDSESDRLVWEEELKGFKGTVPGMKQRHIGKEALHRAVDSVYEEGKDHA